MGKTGRKVMVVLLAMMMLLSTTQQFGTLGENRASADPSSDFAGGSGTILDPFQIANADQLNAVRKYLGADIYFKLTNDIDLSSYSSNDEGKGWTPIGRDDNNSFKGTFNGNGKTISSLYINRPDTDFQALFGFTATTTSISDVNLVNVNVTGGSHTASLVAQNQGGCLSVCRKGVAAPGVIFSLRLLEQQESTGPS